MSLYITGDTHGNFKKLSHASLSKSNSSKKKWSEDDTIIVAGDFGGVWALPNSKYFIKESRMLDKLEHDYKCKILFVDGNHENFDRLNSPTEFEHSALFGGNVSIIRKNIFHLHRGEIYNINDKKIFVMGGATSIDKCNRTEFISWWRREIPSYAEFEKGLMNLELNNFKVDYIISHTAPNEALKQLGIWDKYFDNCPVRSYLDRIHEVASFERWFFGHFHENIFNYRYNCLYEKIMEV